MQQNAGLLTQLVVEMASTDCLTHIPYKNLPRFGHQKAVLTIVLLKMGILMLETC
jgi:hypothetical protein